MLDAGYRVGGDGVFASSGGGALGFDLLHLRDNDFAAGFARALVDQWRGFGIAATEHVVPTMQTTRLPHRDFDAALFDWNAVPEYSYEPQFSSAEIPDAANGYSGFNFGGYTSPQMDGLLAALLRELDPSRRPAIWAQIHALYAEDLPSLPLFNVPSFYVRPRWLTGYAPTGHYIPTTSFAERWARRDGP